MFLKDNVLLLIKFFYFRLCLWINSRIFALKMATNLEMNNTGHFNGNNENGASFDIKPKVQTFIFLDLETSGLDSDSRILELSMVAVSRDELLSMKNLTSNEDEEQNGDESTKKNKRKKSPPLFSKVPPLPRVLHKYTRLYYPRKIIRPIVEEITGLTNFIIDHLEGFTKESAEALRLFVKLPGPVAIVSHNGNSFDFPILRSELLNVDQDQVFSDIRFVDSLIAFRSIDSEIDRKEQEMYRMEAEKRDIEEIMELSQHFHDLPSPVNIDKGDSDESSDSMSVSKNQSFNTNEILIQNSILSNVNSSTPVKSITIDQKDIPKTPFKKRPFLGDTVTPEHSKSQKVLNDASNSSNNVKGARRNLKFKNDKKSKPYSQPTLYHRLFGETYDAHRAEADCLALLQICSYYSEKFVDWADNNFKHLSDFNPRWKKRKSTEEKN